MALSAAAIGSLTRLMARPTKAERLQNSANSAAASRQASSQAAAQQSQAARFEQEQQSEFMARNDRANERIEQREYAASVMERQYEMAEETRRQEQAFKIQTAMTKRKTTATAGGTEVTPAQQGTSRLTDNRSGATIDFSTAEGLRQTRGGVTRQLRGPAPVAPTNVIERGSVEEKRINDTNISYGKEASALEKQLNHLALTKAGLPYDTEGGLVPDGELEIRRYAHAKEAIAIHERLRAIKKQQTSMGYNGPEAKSNANQKISDVGEVAEVHQDEAVADCINQGIDPRSPEGIAHMNNYLNTVHNYRIK